MTRRAEFQRGIMDAATDRSVEVVVVMTSSQVGKALALDTPIPTPDGWATMADLAVGDPVFDETGAVRRVIAISPVERGRRCFAVRFSDGEIIVADAEHRWAVFDRAIKPRVWTTEEIAARFDGGASPARVAVAGPLDLPSADLPVDPYVLGAWLGDGNSAAAVVTCDLRDGVLANLEAILGPLDRSGAGHIVQAHLGRSGVNALCARGHEKKQYASGPLQCPTCSALHGRAKRRGARLPAVPKRQRSGMHGILRMLGLIGDKHIPPAYLRASTAQRWALLQGLMDTDGYAGLRGAVEFTSTSDRLAAGAMELMRTLGLKPALAAGRATLQGRDIGPKYRVTATCYSDQPVFRLARKQSRLRDRSLPGLRQTETTRRSIVAVEPVESVPVKCIAVDSPSRLYLAGRGMIPTHNTECILNLVGYHVDQDPAPLMVLEPTVEMGEAFSKDRLAPMLRDTPRLAGKVLERSRDAGNRVLHKRFTGGHVTIAGANSAASLASRPIRVLLCDEVDRYPVSAGKEGDPVSLARKRTRTFWNRKILLVSTPTRKGLSRIESEWLISDQRRYFVPCPHCGHEQHLQWAGVRWPAGEPDEARYCCEGCGVLWSEVERRVAVRKGAWRATAKGNGRTAGFHLNEIYSPWSSLAEMARDFLEKKGTSETRMTFVNTSLGEPFEEDAERVDWHALQARLEDWGDRAPLGVLAVTCGVDVQEARLEVERVGWGVDEESWSLDHAILDGDPTDPELWRELDEYLLTPTVRADGTEIRVAAACVDSGYQTQRVYTFCRERSKRHVYAVKGISTPGQPRPVIERSKAKTMRDKLRIVGVDAAKDAIYSRLNIKLAGPGFCHFPAGREAIYFEQLTSEIVHTRYVRGRPTRVYILPGGRRNEALDVRVYAYAALHAIGPRWGRLAAQDAQRRAAARLPAAAARQRPTPQIEERAEAPEPTRQPPPPKQMAPRRGRVVRIRRSPW